MKIKMLTNVEPGPGYQDLSAQKKDRQLAKIVWIYLVGLLAVGFIYFGGIDWAGKLWGNLVGKFWDLVLKVFY